MTNEEAILGVLVVVNLSQLVVTAVTNGKLDTMLKYWMTTAERRDKIAQQSEQMIALAKEGQRLMEAERRRMAEAIKPAEK